jgi:hypothetical protein
MIAEAQQLGCVPVATAVGAVGELIVHGEDGLLIDQETDTQIVAHLVQAVVALARDPGRLRRLAEGCLQTAARRSWKGSFSPFLDWCEALVPPKPAPAGQPRQATVLSTATTGISPRLCAEPCAEPLHRLVPPS